MKTKLLLLLIIFIFSIFYFASKGHAEETIGSHIQDAVFETLAGTAAIAGAVEQAATGNFYTGAILTSLAGREFYSAYKDGVNDFDISPSEANFDHGRD